MPEDPTPAPEYEPPSAEQLPDGTPVGTAPLAATLS